MPKKVDFLQSKTRTNLARAFSGECQDGARYQFMAKQAEEQGYQYIKTILKTIAKNEMAHAERFFNLIGQSTDTKQENIDITAGYPFVCGDLNCTLKDSIDTELSQSKNIYPQFAKIAKDEGFPEIAEAFTCASIVEEKHAKQLTEILTKLKSNNLYKSSTSTKWTCSNCGYYKTAKTAWSKCPSCLSPQGFVMINLEEK